MSQALWVYTSDDDGRPMTRLDRLRFALVLVMFALLGVYLQGCGPSYPHAPPALRPLPDRADTATRVDVVCDNSGDFEHGGHGSGVAIDGRHVLTAAHVVLCTMTSVADVRIALRGSTCRMNVAHAWPERDLAVLEVAGDDNFGAIAPPVAKPLYDDEAACSQHSFPDAGGSCGRVTKLTPMWCGAAHAGTVPWCHDAEFAADSVPGNSGSPVWDASGHLVAILTGGTHEEQHGVQVPLGDMLAVRVWPYRAQLGLAE